jgi:WD40 repeat protein
MLSHGSDRLDIAADKLASVTAEDPSAAIGARLGDYELIREIGRGGMGTIYLARRADEEFEKEVAIKILKRGTDTEEVLRRFRAERQILAQLEHPNIARLIDAGTSPDGLPYFVMEYVDGVPITDYCDAAGLNIRERIELFVTVCKALHFAHQNLVVHRDLKPGNILITARGEPKLLDFGIAKLLSSENEYVLTTIQNEQRFTPGYASPEQVRGEPVTTASDVYSLGALLYELLCGKSPHTFATGSPSGTELFRVIVEQEPPCASSVATSAEERRQLRGDLDNILETALRKERERRYSGVTAFADDLRRYLEGMPVRARKDTVTYRAGKFVTRHKLPVAAASCVVIFLIGGIIATTAQRRRAERLQARAEAGEEANRRLLYSAQIGLAYDAWEAGNIERVVQLLEAQRPHTGQVDLRSFEWWLLWNLTNQESKVFRASGRPLCGVAFSPDGNRMVATDRDGNAHFWNVSTGRLEGSVNVGSGAGGVSFTLDGLGIVAPAEDGAALFSSDTGKIAARFTGHGAKTLAVSLSPDGRLLGTASADGTAKLWDLATAQALVTLTGHRDVVTAIAFSPQGETVATASADHTVRLWNTRSGEQLAVLEGHTWWVFAVAFSPDGKLLATAGSDGEVKLWNVEERAELNSIRAAGNTVHAIHFSPDSKLVCIAASDNIISVRSVTTGELVQLLRGHSGTLFALAFAPGSGLLASASNDGTVRLWDLRDRAGATTFEDHRDWTWQVAYSPDGRVLATASKDGTVTLREAQTRRQFAILEHGSWVNSISFSSDGRTLAAASDDGLVRLWNVDTGELIATLRGHPDVAECVAFSPRGRLLVSGGKKGELIFWDSSSHAELARLSADESKLIWAVAFSPDGRLLAVAEKHPTDWDTRRTHAIKVWDVESRRLAARLDGHTDDVRALAFSPDGKTLVSGGEDRTIRQWNLARRGQTAVVKTHSVTTLAVSNDGRRIVSGGQDRTMKIWDFAAPAELCTVTLPAEPSAIAFAPNDTFLAVSGKDNKVHQWRAGITN